MATFVVAHGAWSSAWAWKKMHPLLGADGHRLIIPTLTGLGQRSHLAHPDIDLESHITDVMACLFYNDLRDVCLVGHSYGGMVATGVADRARSHKDADLYRCLRAARRRKCVRRHAGFDAPTASIGGGGRPRQLAHSAGTDAGRHAGGGQGVVRAAPRAAAAQDL